MRVRDWAGTVLVTCLFTAAALFRNQTVLLVALLVVAVVCVVLIVWDTQRHRRMQKATCDDQPVGEAHRDELKELAAAYSKTISYHRATSGKQNEQHERSFWSHFPAAGRALEACDGTLAQRELALAKVRDWLQREDPERGNLLLRHVETSSDPSWHVDAGHLFMDSGWGIAQASNETDIEAIKRPYAELLARARTTPEAGLLRATVDGYNGAMEVAQDELRRIQMLHVIRGRCELC